MGIIQILNSEISNKIAAGEVVERPASVVKELAENSIDAGAGSVTIEIKSGGREYIRVTDDGSGMSEEDAKICFLRHATSKIKTDSDLDAIYTLGFRGEALSSIGAVANVRLSTKRAEDECGICVLCSGGEIMSSEDTAIPNGTSITVENLFFNTPARQKFLKKDATEAGYITDIVTRLILAHPEISFKLIINGREKLFSAGDNSLLNAVYVVYGKDYARHMRPVSYQKDGISITGLASVGTAARANRNYQSFFVNGRYIKSPMITRALEEAYKNQIMIGKYPVAVLNIETSPSLTDINVHPTKLEVKFSNEGEIYRSVFYAVSNALYAEANVPRIEHTKKAENKEGFAAMAENLPNNVKENNAAKRIESGTRPETPSYNPRKNPFLNSSEPEKSGAVSENAVNKEADKKENKESNNIYEARKEETFKASAGVDEEGFDFSAPAPKGKQERIQGYYDTVAQLDFLKNNNVAAEPEKRSSVLAEEEQPSETVSPAEDNVFVDEYFKIVGQVFDTYIIAEKGDEMLIVDQHAAHERLKFEELRRHMENKEPFSQLLIEPVTVSVNAEELEAFEENKESFNSMGFECDEFGSDTVIIRAVPGELEPGEAEDLLLELLNEAKNLKRELITDRQMRLLETIACKSAVKANMHLSTGEMQELLRNVLRMKNINTCPHGRPIIITMSKKELEKEFGRIV